MNNSDVVWITGASSGIGQALAIELSRLGVKLVLTARREDELLRVRNMCAKPDLVHVLPGDLLDPAKCTDLAKEAESLAGPIDVLVNNAGLIQRALAQETEAADVRRIMELNFFAPVALTKAVVPGMVKRGRGQIVVISSVAGYVGTPLRSTYAASKHAVRGYFDSLRAELHPSGVDVLIVCPGYIQTAATENAIGAAGQRYGKRDDALANGMPSDECARRIATAMRDKRSEVIIGGKETYAVYLKRWFPSRIERAVRKGAPS